MFEIGTKVRFRDGHVRVGEEGIVKSTDADLVTVDLGNGSLAVASVHLLEPVTPDIGVEQLEGETAKVDAFKQYTIMVSDEFMQTMREVGDRLWRWVHGEPMKPRLKTITLPDGRKLRVGSQIMARCCARGERSVKQYHAECRQVLFTRRIFKPWGEVAWCGWVTDAKTGQGRWEVYDDLNRLYDIRIVHEVLDALTPVEKTELAESRKIIKQIKAHAELWAERGSTEPTTADSGRLAGAAYRNAGKRLLQMINGVSR